jgi:hypothetical protein
MSDNQDANQLIINSVPLAGMPKPLIDQHQATKIRCMIALALGMEDEVLAARLAYFQRTGDVWREVRRAHDEASV